MYQTQVCDINVRTSQRFLACSGFVSVFSSALVTRCVLAVFAVEVLHKLG